MTTFEWISLIAILFGGFWKLSSDLSKIRETLVGKVSNDECMERQKTCPFRDRILHIEERTENLAIEKQYSLKQSKENTKGGD